MAFAVAHPVPGGGALDASGDVFMALGRANDATGYRSKFYGIRLNERLMYMGVHNLLVRFDDLPAAQPTLRGRLRTAVMHAAFQLGGPQAAFWGSAHNNDFSSGRFLNHKVWFAKNRSGQAAVSAQRGMLNNFVHDTWGLISEGGAAPLGAGDLEWVVGADLNFMSVGGYYHYDHNGAEWMIPGVAFFLAVPQPFPPPANAALVAPFQAGLTWRSPTQPALFKLESQLPPPVPVATAEPYPIIFPYAKGAVPGYYGPDKNNFDPIPMNHYNFGGVGGLREGAHRYDSLIFRGLPRTMRNLINDVRSVVQLPSDAASGVRDDHNCIVKILGTAYGPSYRAYAEQFAPDWYAEMSDKHKQGLLVGRYVNMWTMDWIHNRLSSISIYQTKLRRDEADARDKPVPVATLAQFCSEHRIPLTLVNAGDPYTGAVRVNTDHGGRGLKRGLMLVLKDTHYYWVSHGSFASDVAVQLYQNQALTKFPDKKAALDVTVVPTSSNNVLLFGGNQRPTSTTYGATVAVRREESDLEQLLLDGLPTEDLEMMENEDGPATYVKLVSYEDLTAMRVFQDKGMVRTLLQLEEKMPIIAEEVQHRHGGAKMLTYVFFEEQLPTGTTRPMNLLPLILALAEATRDATTGAMRICNRNVRARVPVPPRKDQNYDGVAVTAFDLRDGLRIVAGSRDDAQGAHLLACALETSEKQPHFRVSTPHQVFQRMLLRRTTALGDLLPFQPDMYPDAWQVRGRFFPAVSATVRPTRGVGLVELDVRLQYTSVLLRAGPVFDEILDRGGPWMLDTMTSDVHPWRGNLDFPGQVLVRLAPGSGVPMDDPFHRGLTEFRWVNTTLLRDYVGRFPALETHLEMTHERESRDLRPATVFAPVLRTMLTDAIKGLVPLETLKRALNGGVGLMRKAAMPGGTVDFFDPSSDAGSVSLQRLRYPTMSTTPLLPRLALTTTTVQLLNVIPTTVLWEQLLQLAAYQMMLLDDRMRTTSLGMGTTVHCQTDALFLETRTPLDAANLLPASWRVNPDTTGTAALFATDPETQATALLQEIGRVKVTRHVSPDTLPVTLRIDPTAAPAHTCPSMPPPALAPEDEVVVTTPTAALLDWTTTAEELELLTAVWDASPPVGRPRPTTPDAWRSWFREIRADPRTTHAAALTARAADFVCEHPDGCAVLGGGGRGKTYLLNVVKRRLEAAGERVGVCAFTNAAVQTLHEAGVEDARTIHQLLKIQVDGIGHKQGQDNNLGTLRSFDTLIVDEVSMVPRPIMRRLLLLRASERLDPAETPSHVRLLFFGDDLQLGPVESRRAFMVEYTQAFRQLCGDRRLRMQLNKRDAEDTLEAFDTAMRTGDPTTGLRMFRDQTYPVRFLETLLTRHPDTQMVFWRNRDRLRFQALASARQATTAPGGPIVLNMAKGWHDREDGAPFLTCCAGLKVVCHEPNYAGKRHRTEGADDPSEAYLRNEMFTVRGHDDDSVHLERDRRRPDVSEMVHVPKRHFGRFTAGMTVHRMQGRQCDDDAVVVVPLFLFRERFRTGGAAARQFVELWYTAITRYTNKRHVRIVDCG